MRYFFALLLCLIPQLARAVDKPTIPSLSIRSTGFRDGETLPAKYTADGANISPHLAWEGAPVETASFIVMMEDPDALGSEPFVHWLVYNIPGTARELPEGSNGGGVVGSNSWGKIAYGGPQPPTGTGTHHYKISVYALKEPLQIFKGSTKSDVLNASRGKVVGTGSITGLYKR